MRNSGKNGDIEHINVAPPDTRFYGYTIVWSAFLIGAVVMAVYFAFGVFLKPILNEFGWSRGLTAGAFSLSWIVQGLLSTVAGRLNDRYGPRQVITACGFIMGITFLLMSQINSAWQLYMLYGVMLGIGLSGVALPLTSTLSKWFIRRRNIMTGIATSGVGAGTLVGPFIADRLITALDWRHSYLILGSIVLVAVIAAAQLLRRDPVQVGQVPYGANYESKNIADVDIFRPSFKTLLTMRQFWLIFSIFFCVAFINFTVYVHIVPHATDLGIAPAMAASIMTVIGVFTILGILILSTTADRIGNQKVYIIGLSMVTGSLIWFFFANNILTFYLFAMVFSFPISALNATQAPFIASYFGLGAHGLIMGVLLIGYCIGAALGPYLTGYMFDLFGSYFWPFFICTILSVLGIILTIVLKPGDGQIVKKGLPSGI